MFYDPKKRVIGELKSCNIYVHKVVHISCIVYSSLSLRIKRNFSKYTKSYMFGNVLRYGELYHLITWK